MKIRRFEISVKATLLTNGVTKIHNVVEIHKSPSKGDDQIAATSKITHSGMENAIIYSHT